MNIDTGKGEAAGPNALAIARLVRSLKHMERDNLSARGTGKPPPCACGATFTSFRGRKEHLRACLGRPAQSKEQGT